MAKDVSFKRRLENFNWGPGLFLIIYHLMLLVGLPLYFLNFSTSWGMIITSSVLMYITGLSVTMGYHRLYSHTTYKLNPVVEAIMLFFATMATQGSALRWSFDHRHHHAFVDTDRDPYSIKKGFWYAHFMWLFEKPKEIDMKVVSDLARSPLLRFQHKYYGILNISTNVLAFLVLGWIFQDYLGAFLFGWLTRMFFLHHLTWFINSLAHTWGSRNFCQELSAVDNYIIALLTFGEGYHNYHHTFAYDYRNGIRWFHFDPTKWLIWGLYKLGLARQLRRVQKYQIVERVLVDRKRLILDQIHTSLHGQKEEWEKKVTAVIENVTTNLKQVKKLTDSYYELKKSKEGKKDHLQDLKHEIKALQKTIKQEYQQWLELSRDFTDLSASQRSTPN